MQLIQHWQHEVQNTEFRLTWIAAIGRTTISLRKCEAWVMLNVSEIDLVLVLGFLDLEALLIESSLLGGKLSSQGS